MCSPEHSRYVEKVTTRTAKATLGASQVKMLIYRAATWGMVSFSGIAGYSKDSD